MPDLLASEDTRRGDRSLVQDERAAVRAPLELPAEAVAYPYHQEAAVLQLEQVTKWYGPVIGVNQISLELRPGITGLVGHNGAGKSTLLRLAAGQIRPDLGRVMICGHDAWTSAAKRHVGYCPDNDRFYEEMSGRAFVEAMAQLCGYPRREALRRVEHTLDLVGMTDRAHRRIAGYSKGMRQRIKLAQALLHDPDLLLLDEPLSGIDPIGRRESIELFRRLSDLGKCLLISSHELDELEKLTDHVAIMSSGRIAAVGTLSQIRDLLDDHPRSIRIECEEPKRLATLLLNWDDVVGLDREVNQLVVRVRQSRQFFQRFMLLVIEENLEITRLEALDESTRDVLGYLLGGK